MGLPAPRSEGAERPGQPAGPRDGGAWPVGGQRGRRRPRVARRSGRGAWACAGGRGAEGAEPGAAERQLPVADEGDAVGPAAAIARVSGARAEGVEALVEANRGGDGGQGGTEPPTRPGAGMMTLRRRAGDAIRVGRTGRD